MAAIRQEINDFVKINMVKRVTTSDSHLDWFLWET
jgi:hypothetical protein